MGIVISGIDILVEEHSFRASVRGRGLGWRFEVSEHFVKL